MVALKREERLRLCSRLFARDITSTKELGYAEILAFNSLAYRPDKTIDPEFLKDLSVFYQEMCLNA